MTTIEAIKKRIIFCFEDSFLKKVKQKNENNNKNENLCKYDPAIFSLPKGPPNLLAFPSKPNMSNPL